MTLAKTDAGVQVLRTRQAALTPRQRAALILFDGQRTVDDVLAATAPGGVTRADIERLVAMGLVAEQAPHLQFPDSGLPGTAERERYLQAYGIATMLTAELGPKWGTLNLAVEAAGTLEELQELAPRIRAAVDPRKFAELEAALQPR
ncbi:MAG TPA: hypothetical protein VHL79_20040 [Ramlibacter sp.]|jgi:hypothetical protein|nr:hypothetical protein [Ramlibacter sp.]